MPAAGFHGKEPRIGEVTQTIVEICVNSDFGKIVVVEAGAPQTLVVKSESQGLDQVQCRAAVCAQANGVACIRGNLGLEQHDMKHGRWLWSGRDVGVRGCAMRAMAALYRRRFAAARESRAASDSRTRRPNCEIRR